MKNNNGLNFFIAIVTLPFASILLANPASSSLAYLDTASNNLRENIYLGGAIGASEAESYCVINKGCEDKDTSWKAFVGYKITEIFDIELAYTSVGDLHKQGNFSDISALSASGVAKLPINHQFSLFGKAGLSNWTSENTMGEETGFGFNYGLGAKITLNESMKLRAEWERLPAVATSNTEESSIDVLSVGIEISTD